MRWRWGCRGGAECCAMESGEAQLYKCAKVSSVSRRRISICTRAEKESFTRGGAGP